MRKDLQHSQGGRCRRQASCLWWWLCRALGPAGWGLWRSFLCGKHRIPWRAGRGTPPTGPAGLPQGQRTEKPEKHPVGTGTGIEPLLWRLKQCENQPWLSSLWRGHIQRAPPSSGGTRPRGASSERTPGTKKEHKTHKESCDAFQNPIIHTILILPKRHSPPEEKK